MFKNILIYLIFGLFIFIITNNTTPTNTIINEKFQEINENNFTMSHDSIIMSRNNNLTQNECLNKINDSDINGASYELNTNICTLYFFAKKGLENINFNSKIYI